MKTVEFVRFRLALIRRAQNQTWKIEMVTHKLKVTNDRSSFITLWLEPWGADYGLLPTDEIEIIAKDPSADFCVNVCDAENGIQVWIEGNVEDLSVLQAGVELECGHNRREESW